MNGNFSQGFGGSPRINAPLIKRPRMQQSNGKPSLYFLAMDEHQLNFVCYGLRSVKVAYGNIPFMFCGSTKGSVQGDSNGINLPAGAIVLTSTKSEAITLARASKNKLRIVSMGDQTGLTSLHDASVIGSGEFSRSCSFETTPEQRLGLMLDVFQWSPITLPALFKMVSHDWCRISFESDSFMGGNDYLKSSTGVWFKSVLTTVSDSELQQIALMTGGDFTNVNILKIPIEERYYENFS